MIHKLLQHYAAKHQETLKPLFNLLPTRIPTKPTLAPTKLCPALHLVDIRTDSHFYAQKASFANNAVRSLLRNFDAKDLTILQSIRWYTTAPQIMRWDPIIAAVFRQFKTALVNVRTSSANTRQDLLA